MPSISDRQGTSRHLSRSNFLQLIAFVPRDFLCLVRLRDIDVVKVVELGLRLAFALENIAAEPPRELLPALEGCVCLRRHPEDVIQLFQCPLLGFIKEEEDEEEGDDVEASVEAEDAGGRECREHTREGDGEDGAPEVY